MDKTGPVDEKLLLAMNEALLLGSLRQHELTESTDRLNAQLLAEIAERKNVELELHAAILIAEKANRAKSDFLSSMSHELRTPLSAILGFAQLIESGSPEPTPAQKRSVEQILKAGWYLLDLINEILDLALIESSTLPLTMESIALDDIMLECQSMAEAQALKHGIQMRFARCEGRCLVLADRMRIKQVLANLLSNAIKYNRAGGTVEVNFEPVDPQRVRIRVEDTGDGLSAEKLVQLFQPFNRLGRETGSEQGTGIGLVVSKRLVELMHGAIGVESIVGKGSVFWFELNLAPEQAPAAAPGDSRELAPTTVEGTSAMRTLLYVEDNPANLMLIEDLVARRTDIRLLSAADGVSGVELAIASLPDVILMDINLPGISGIEALKILRANPATARIPIIALSANAMSHDIDEGLQAGFFRYLTKPIRVDKFMATLDEALNLAQAASVRANSEQPI